MKITRMYNQHRRDFTFDAECEHCGAVVTRQSGYDDHNFHQNVVPNTKCRTCGKTSPEGVDRPDPKYPAWAVV